MASIKLQGNSGGSGSVILTAPNTNSTRTITLPDQDINFGNLGGAGSTQAWVNFNGTGTVAIRDDGNVSSVTDNGTGDYNIAFSTALTSSSFAINHGGRRITNNTNESALNLGIYGTGNFSTSSNRVLTYDNNSDGRQDCQQIGFSAIL